MGTPARERQKAYMKRSEELGFKRVNLRVPTDCVAQIKKLAQTMCEEAHQQKDGHAVSPNHQKKNQPT
ncbi:hypothetical protein KBA01_29860 [Kozakia baliensis]|nr:hypothetical protein KBA01_29860 [Kozakia baliensis]